MASDGLLSGMLNFVSRELESFVTSATGRTTPEPRSQSQSRREERKHHGYTTMPGSLYPRSESVQPDSVAGSSRRSMRPPAVPMKQIASQPSPEKNKGKKRAIEEEEVEAEDVEEIARISWKAKGKERDRRERDLLDARNEQARHTESSSEPSHSADKERIQMLENEVERLKQELSQRPVSYSRPGPPPAPPPLPPPFATRIPSTGNTLVSARASLKQTSGPVEAPINPHPSKRHGQPTIGIPPDKMMAFLNEMKTVRLRKVANHRDVPPTQVEQPRRFSLNGTSRGDSNYGLAANNSLGSVSLDGISRIGEKRKRLISSHNEPDTSQLKKRNMTAASHLNAVASSSYNPFSRANLNPTSVPAWQLRASSSLSTTRTGMTTTSSAATDVTTPSLCSDSGDNDHRSPSGEDDNLPPSTPPAAEITIGPKAEELERVVFDVDMGSEYLEPLRKPAQRVLKVSNIAAASKKKPFERVKHKNVTSAEFLANRVPSSPLPAATPRKPRPPARGRISALNLGNTGRKQKEREEPEPESEQEQSDGEDPLSLTFDAPLNRRSTHSNTSSRAETATKSANHARRKTLDDELQEAFAASNYSREDEEDLDNGVLIAVGTRPKNLGFLAHGGAGGPSVFMGAGYVEGVQDPDPTQDEENTTTSQTQTRRKKNASRR